MAIQVTTWRPDTCDCILHYAWDDSVPASARVHTLAAVTRRCAPHAALTDLAAHYAVINDENPRKGRALSRVQVFLGATDDQMATVTWSFAGTGAARVLTVAIPFATSNQKSTMQTWADANLGAGKVLVV